MYYPYTNQKKAKRQLRPGQYILFAENGCKAVNSGTVTLYEWFPIAGAVIDVKDINGKGESATFELSQITLYRDKEWEDIK